MSGDTIRRKAGLSSCRRYRYWLTRTWGDDGDLSALVAIGLNPSTADETTDDHTIRRLMSYARAWGHTGLVMLNLFAFRSTDPKALAREVDPVGPENDAHLTGWTQGRRVLCAWGAHDAARDRAAAVHALLAGRSLVCFGTTKAGHPKHPARLPDGLHPLPFGGAS